MLEYFAGIDWGSETHQVCVLDSAGEVSAERAFSHGGAGLAEMAAWILARAGVDPHAVGVAIEIPHGPVVETMMERGFTVHSVNPKQLDRFRDRFSPAGAKDDRRDARVLADALRTDGHAFRRLDPAAPEIVELREWSRIANDLTRDRTRLVNRARQQLWRYYPQLLKVESDLTRTWVRELWCLAPTPARAQRVRAATVAKLLKRHRVRRIDAETALRIMREQAVSVAPGTTEAAVAHIEVVFSQLAVIAQQLAKAYGELDRLSAALSRSPASPEDEPGTYAQRDVEILSSLPGVGRIVLATLLAEAHDPLRRRDYQALRCLSGVAPVTRTRAVAFPAPDDDVLHDVPRLRGDNDFLYRTGAQPGRERTHPNDRPFRPPQKPDPAHQRQLHDPAVDRCRQHPEPRVHADRMLAHLDQRIAEPVHIDDGGNVPGEEPYAGDRMGPLEVEAAPEPGAVHRDRGDHAHRVVAVHVGEMPEIDRVLGCFLRVSREPDAPELRPAPVGLPAPSGARSSHCGARSTSPSNSRVSNTSSRAALGGGPAG